MRSKQLSPPHGRPFDLPFGRNSTILRRLWLNRGRIHCPGRISGYRIGRTQSAPSAAIKRVDGRRPKIPVPAAFVGRKRSEEYRARRYVIFCANRISRPTPFASIFQINSMTSAGSAAGTKTLPRRNFLRISGFNCWRALQRDLLARAGGSSLCPT